MLKSLRFFAKHDELHAFHTQVSRLLAHATMFASYATRNYYVLTRIPARVRFPIHANLLVSCVMQKLLTHVTLLCE